MPCAVRLALAILQEQGDQPVAVVLAYAAADDDVRLVGIGGLQGEQSFREPQAHGSTCCTRRHSRLPSVSSRVGGVELVRLQHLAPGREATQRVAVDGVLGGELLVVTAERAVQVGQREPLQLVATLLFPGTSSTDCSLTRRTVAARSDTTRRVRLSGTLSHLRGDSGEPADVVGTGHAVSRQGVVQGAWERVQTRPGAWPPPGLHEQNTGMTGVAHQYGEVPYVLGDQASTVRERGVQDGDVITAGEFYRRGDRDHVVALVTQGISERGWVYLVQQEASGHEARSVPRSRSCSACHAASASRAVCWFAAIRSSMSSRYEV